MFKENLAHLNYEREEKFAIAKNWTQTGYTIEENKMKLLKNVKNKNH